ncbi:MAG: aspartate-semialdehyde dehydrogenase [bacterium]
MAKEGYKVAVLGATGMVGQEMIKVLEERKFPVSEFLPLASERSAGKKVKYNGKNYDVIVATPEVFNGVEIGLFSAGAKISEKLAHEAVRRGTVVIDNTSFFRMHVDVPLVVPEVNGYALRDHKGIIANPNCSTAQLVLALKPIHDAAKIKRVVVSTYQSTSGWGKEAVEELYNQTRAVLEGKKPKVDTNILPKQIAFNLFPHIDQFTDNGYTKEELKMTNETRKILNDDSIMLTATTVRVPVKIGHSESVNIVTEKKLTADEVRKLISKVPTVVVMDDPKNNVYPTPLECEGKNETFVGRIREDISHPNGIELWVVSDNLRRGAALNAVLIAESLIKQSLI